MIETEINKNREWKIEKEQKLRRGLRSHAEKRRVNRYIEKRMVRKKDIQGQTYTRIETQTSPNKKMDR